MTAIILTAHTLIVLGLIVMVLLQRSDGGALGIGGGNTGGLMSGRSAANALTRTTSILAALFFATSLGLAVLAGAGENEDAAIQELTGSEPAAPDAAPGEISTDDLLNSLGGNDDADAPALTEGEAAIEAAEDILDQIGVEDDTISTDVILNEEPSAETAAPEEADAAADAPASEAEETDNSDE